MPYKSLAQAALFHSRNSPVSPDVVKEWDTASKGKMGHLPRIAKAIKRKTKVKHG